MGARSEYSSQIAGADYEEKTFDGNVYQLTQNSKQWAGNDTSNYSGMAIAKVLQDQGVLRPYLVFALGTNSPNGVTDGAIDDLMTLVGTNHKVVLVTNYALDNQRDFTENNKAIRSAASRYSGKVAVADWAAEVGKDPTKYIDDTLYYVHPNAAGSKLFVSLIKDALNSLASGSNGVNPANNLNYAGQPVLSDAQLAAVEANQPFYEAAAAKYGFPWELLATVHYAEHGLQRDNPANGQGAYQLYSHTHIKVNDELVLNPETAFLPAGEISDEEFQRQTDIAASVVAGKGAGMDLNNLSENNIKRILFLYNGRSQVYVDRALRMGFTSEQAENGEGSPYVMNKYDAERDPTSGSMSAEWKGSYSNDLQYNPDAQYMNYGTFVVYQAIAGGSYCSSGGGTIVNTAIELSWEGYRSHDKADPKPEYEAAMHQVGTWFSGGPCDGLGTCAPNGASCDVFVATVLRYSGVDPEFPTYGPQRQMDWMDDHPDMYMKVEANRNTDNLEPGDIFVVSTSRGKHIYLFIGIMNGEPWQASASFNGRTGEHYAGISWDDYGMDYSVYRRINY